MESRALRSKDIGKFGDIAKAGLHGCDRLPCLEVKMDRDSLRAQNPEGSAKSATCTLLGVLKGKHWHIKVLEFA